MSRNSTESRTDRAGAALAQWRRERPDLDVSPMAVLGRLSEASSLISKTRLAPVFQKFGLQSGEFDVLATLRRSGPPFALTPTALYEATMVTSGAMTNRIDRLETLGLIARRPHPVDRRGTIVELTEQGRALIDAAMTEHVRNEHAILSCLSAPEREVLGELLRKLIEGIGRMPAEVPPD